MGKGKENGSVNVIELEALKEGEAIAGGGLLLVSKPLVILLLVGD